MLKINDYLTPAEREQVLKRSDLWALWLVLSTWTLTLSLLWLAGAFPHPVTIVLVWALLGGRQLGLSVLMHEAGHHTLFANRVLNQRVGQWLCALPTLNDLTAYATGHLDHHRLTGTPEDPDLPNYQAYPVDGKSFRRKVVRDLTGQTGFKLIAGILRGGLVHFGGRSSDGNSLLL